MTVPPAPGAHAPRPSDLRHRARPGSGAARVASMSRPPAPSPGARPCCPGSSPPSPAPRCCSAASRRWPEPTPGEPGPTRPASRGSTTRPAPSASSTPWSGASTGPSTGRPAARRSGCAAYSFAMPSTAQALRRAHRRGVRVQVVVDDRSAQWGSVRALRRELGTSTRRHSFVRVCDHSCRGTTGNQHAKFVTISRSGRADGRRDGRVDELHRLRRRPAVAGPLRGARRPPAVPAVPDRCSGRCCATSRRTRSRCRRPAAGCAPTWRRRGAPTGWSAGCPWCAAAGPRTAPAGAAAPCCGSRCTRGTASAAWRWPAGSPSCARRAATCGCSRASASAGRSARS